MHGKANFSHIYGAVRVGVGERYRYPPGPNARGDGVAKDHAQTLHWWCEAAAQGCPQAQKRLDSLVQKATGQDMYFTTTCRYLLLLFLLLLRGYVCVFTLNVSAGEVLRTSTRPTLNLLLLLLGAYIRASILKAIHAPILVRVFVIDDPPASDPRASDTARGPRRKPGASSYTLTCLSLSSDIVSSACPQ